MAFTLFRDSGTFIYIHRAPSRNLRLGKKNSVHKIKHHCKNAYVEAGGKNVLLQNYLKNPTSSIYDGCIDAALIKNHSSESIFTAETDIKYEGYVKIENMRAEKIKRLEKIIIPYQFNYKSISGLSNESREKLTRIRPETLGQASRLAGVRQADIGIIAVYLHSR